jgi:hypothetical protein
MGDIKIREIIKYTNYKRFGAKSKIIYEGKEVQKGTEQKKPEDQKPPEPEKPQ